jgi:hypothetical protein
VKLVPLSANEKVIPLRKAPIELQPLGANEKVIPLRKAPIELQPLGADEKVIPLYRAPKVKNPYPEETPSAGESFTSGILKGAMSIPISVTGAFNPKYAAEANRNIEAALPSPGVAGFAGEAIGSIIPTAAAVAVPGLAPAMLATYTASGVGQGREEVYNLRKKGVKVNRLMEALVAAGYGASERIPESEALRRFTGLAIKKWGKKTGEEIAKQVAEKGVTRFLKDIGVEAGQEAATQVGQSAAQSWVDPKSRFLSTETAKQAVLSAAGGAIGGGLIGGQRHLMDRIGGGVGATGSPPVPTQQSAPPQNNVENPPAGFIPLPAEAATAGIDLATEARRERLRALGGKKLVPLADGEKVIPLKKGKETVVKSVLAQTPQPAEAKIAPQAATATFIGYQETADGGAFPLFNIEGEHPRKRSTVSTETLKDLGIAVPAHPTLAEWTKAEEVNVQQKPQSESQNPASNKRTMMIIDKQRTVELSPENAAKFDKLDSDLKERQVRRKSMLDHAISVRAKGGKADYWTEDFNRESKADAMETAAEKRKLDPRFATPLEAEKAKEREENVNYVGKRVSVNGELGIVQGTAFGRVKIKFDDGSVRSVGVDEPKPVSTTQPPVAKESVKPEAVKPVLPNPTAGADRVQTDVKPEGGAGIITPERIRVGEYIKSKPPEKRLPARETEIVVLGSLIGNGNNYNVTMKEGNKTKYLGSYKTRAEAEKYQDHVNKMEKDRINAPSVYLMVHRREVKSSLNEGRLSPADYDAIHAKDYGAYGSDQFKSNFPDVKIAETEETKEETRYNVGDKFEMGTIIDNPFQEGSPSQYKAKRITEYFNKNNDKYNPKYIILYHGTSQNVPIESKGLLPTSYERRRSYQSQSGYIYLANTPERAMTFGQLGNQGKSVVYEVVVPINRILPDLDQLNNIRSTGVKVGNTIGESVVYGGGIRVKGKIDSYAIRKLPIATPEVETVTEATPHPEPKIDAETTARRERIKKNAKKFIGVDENLGIVSGMSDKQLIEFRNDLIAEAKAIAAKTYLEFKEHIETFTGKLTQAADIKFLKSVWNDLQTPSKQEVSETPDEEWLSFTKGAIARSFEDHANEPEFNEKERQKQVEVLREAKEAGLQNTALDIALDVIMTPQPITAHQAAGMMVKKAMLIVEEKELRAIQKQNIKDKNVKSAKDTNDMIREVEMKIGTLDNALRIAGRSAGRMIAILNRAINVNTFDYLSIRREIKEILEHAPTAELEAKIRELTDQLKDAEKREEELISALEKIGDAKERAEAELRARKERRKSEHKATRQRLISSGKSQREKGEKTLHKLLGRMNDVTGAVPEALLAIKDIAVGYIREKSATLDEVIEYIQNKFPEVTDRDIYRALNLVSHRAIDEAKKRIEKQIVAVKKEAKLLERLEAFAEDNDFGLNEKGKIRRDKLIGMKDALDKITKEAYRSAHNVVRLTQIIEKTNILRSMMDKGLLLEKGKAQIDPEDIAIAKKALRDLRLLMAAKETIATLEEQLRTGNIPPKAETRPLTAPTTDLDKARAEVYRLKRAIRELVESQRQLSWLEWGIETLDISRVTGASSDISGLFRQAGMYFLKNAPFHPIGTTKAIVRSLKYLSETNANQLASDIENHPLKYLFDAVGLDLTSVGIVHGEEQFGNRVLAWMYSAKSPKVRYVVSGATYTIRASERHMVSLLNAVRISMMEEFMSANKSVTLPELKAWAKFVNAATGRGNIKTFGREYRIFSKMFWSLRFAISRFETPSRMLFADWNFLRSVKKEQAKMLAGLITTYGLMALLAKLNDYEVVTDWLSPDFLKIKDGNTRYDLVIGFVPVARLIVQLAYAIAVAQGAEPDRRYPPKEPLDLFRDFAKYKLAPVVTLPMALATGKDIFGRNVTKLEAVRNAFIPMSLGDIITAYDEGGVTQSVESTIANMIGFGASTYLRNITDYSNEKQLSKIAMELVERQKTGNKTHEQAVKSLKSMLGRGSPLPRGNDKDDIARRNEALKEMTPAEREKAKIDFRNWERKRDIAEREVNRALKEIYGYGFPVKK